MTSRRFSFLALAVLFLPGVALPGDGIPNWPAPASWSPQRASHGVTTLGDVSSPLPFIAVTPCRVADTRGNGFTGAYGPPALVANATRNFTITGQCGIPSGASAVSFNFGALNVGAAGDLRVFPTGGGIPLVSTMNYNGNTPNIANAAVVPLGTGGAIRVLADAVSIDLIIDVNGYYASTPATPTDYFSVINSGLYAIYGETSNPDPFAAGVYGRATAGPAQGVFGETLSTADGTAGVFGRATSAVGNSAGVAGQTNAATDGATGVFGLAKATTGQTFGVWGTTNSVTNGSTGVSGVANATTGHTFGVGGRNKSTTDDASAVLGEAVGTSGQIHGVDGETYSSTDYTTGVLGNAVSTTGQVFGVLGASHSLVSGVGVAGALIDTAGNPTVYGVLGAAIGTAGDTTGPPWGVFAFGNLGAMGTKHFVEPHPSDPTKVILYSSLEGREVGTYFRGTARVVNHEAVIEVPEDFRIVTDDAGLTVQLTPTGASSSLYVESKDLNRIVVKASRDVTFDYLVQGVRRAFKNLQPIRVGYEFVPRSPSDTMRPYLTEEARRRLIANGTFNADGTVNMETAERLGWAEAWRERGERARSSPLPSPPADPGIKAEK